MYVHEIQGSGLVHGPFFVYFLSSVSKLKVKITFNLYEEDPLYDCFCCGGWSPNRDHLRALPGCLFVNV